MGDHSSPDVEIKNYTISELESGQGPHVVPLSDISVADFLLQNNIYQWPLINSMIYNWIWKKETSEKRLIELSTSSLPNIAKSLKSWKTDIESNGRSQGYSLRSG